MEGGAFMVEGIRSDTAISSELYSLGTLHPLSDDIPQILLNRTLHGTGS